MDMAMNMDDPWNWLVLGVVGAVVLGFLLDTIASFIIKIRRGRRGEDES